MQIITHQSHLDALPESTLREYITARFNQLSEDTDVPPNLILVEPNDNLIGPDFAFVNETRGLIGDQFEESTLGETGFVRPYEWVSYLPALQLYEVLLLVNNEDGYLIIIPEAIVNSCADLHWVLTSEEAGGLSTPQPLY